MVDCAACKHQRRRISKSCVLAPYFPADRPDDYTNARKLYGRNNLVKRIKKLPLCCRNDAITTVKIESNAFASDPGYYYRTINKLATAISYVDQELNNTNQKLDFFRGIIVGDRGFVNVNLDASSINLEEYFKNVPPNPISNAGASSSWTSLTFDQNNQNLYNSNTSSVNDAGFSWNIHPNTFFSQPEWVHHGNVGETSVPSLNDQPIGQLSSSRVSESEHINNEDELDISISDYGFH